jgi:pimeloyl-ACP methyl ester carboxylesterase
MEAVMTSTTFARTVRGTGSNGVALAHGAGGSVAAHYGAILEDLAAQRSVVGVDYPGSGATPRSSTPLSLDQLADELVAAAVDQGFDRFAVLGFSVGGPVAIRAATRHPERVSALVLTATLAHLDGYMKLTTDISGAVLAAGNPDLMAKLLTFLYYSPQALASMGEPELQDAAAAAIPSAGAPEQYAMISQVDARAELTNIKAPTLVITTTEDKVIPLYLQRQLAAGIPGARTAEIASGHLVAAEQPGQWTRLITSFLDDAGA